MLTLILPIASVLSFAPPTPDVLPSDHLTHGSTSGVCVAVAPDGKLFFSTPNEAVVHLWDPVTKKEVATFPCHFKEKVAFFHLTSDGKILITLGRGDLAPGEKPSDANQKHEIHVWVWDVASKTVLHKYKLPRPSPGIPHSAITPDGATLIACYPSGLLSQFDLNKGKEINTLEADFNINTLTFSPDGKWLATGNVKGGITIWDLKQQKSIANLNGGKSMIAALVFSPDSKTLASVADDNLQKGIALWDVGKGELRDELAFIGPISALAFSPDGRTLACLVNHQNTLRLWDLEKKDLRSDFKGRMHGKDRPSTPGKILFAPDGKTVITSTFESEDFLFWDIPQKP